MQDTIDAVTGRRVRQASQAASQAIAETVHWFQHNPYRVSATDAEEPVAAARGTSTDQNGEAEAPGKGETDPAAASGKDGAETAAKRRQTKPTASSEGGAADDDGDAVEVFARDGVCQPAA